MTPERFAFLRNEIAGGPYGIGLAEALDEIERLRGLLDRTIPILAPAQDDDLGRVCGGCSRHGHGSFRHDAGCLYVAVWRTVKTDPLPHGDTVERSVSRIPESEWVWQGHAGHFICADRCKFRMATRVGGVLVSTVGEMYTNPADEEPSPIGAGADSLFETMVFAVTGTIECGCAQWDGHELACRRYATAAEAQAGHLEFCRKYAANGGEPCQ